MIVLQDFTLPRTLVAPPPCAAAAPARPSRSPPPRASRSRRSRGAPCSRPSARSSCRALEQCRWNRVKTAKMLKISYRALLYKIKDMGLKQDSAAG